MRDPGKNHERVIDAGENHAACAALFIGGFMGMGNKFSMPREAFEFSATEKRLIPDVDKNGQVSKDEFLAAPHQRDNPEQMFTAMDVHKRGYLTKDEFCSDKGMGMGKGMGQGQGTGTNQ